MIEFLQALQPEGNGRFTELRMIRNGEVKQLFIPLTDRDVIAEAAMKNDAEGRDVFFGVLPRMSASGRAEDCAPDTGVLIADIDNKAVGGTHLAALMRVGALNLTPSIIVDSGNGLHCYWLLDGLAPFARVKPLMQGLQSAIGSDHVHDAPRVLRLPGTHNHKGCSHGTVCPECGIPAVSIDQLGVHTQLAHKLTLIAGDDKCLAKPVRLLHFEPERRYRLSDFDDFMPVEVVSRSPIYSHNTKAEGWEPSNGAPPFPEGTRNASLTRIAGIMVARGMTPIGMLAALLDENNRRCQPPLPPAEVERIVRSVSRYR